MLKQPFKVKVKLDVLEHLDLMKLKRVWDIFGRFCWILIYISCIWLSYFVYCFYNDIFLYLIFVIILSLFV